MEQTHTEFSFYYNLFCPLVFLILMKRREDLEKSPNGQKKNLFIKFETFLNCVPSSVLHTKIYILCCYSMFYVFFYLFLFQCRGRKKFFLFFLRRNCVCFVPCNFLEKFFCFFLFIFFDVWFEMNTTLRLKKLRHFYEIITSYGYWLKYMYVIYNNNILYDDIIDICGKTKFENINRLVIN